jgi:hypothetical protein
VAIANAAFSVQPSAKEKSSGCKLTADSSDSESHASANHPNADLLLTQQAAIGYRPSARKIVPQADG